MIERLLCPVSSSTESIVSRKLSPSLVENWMTGSAFSFLGAAHRAAGGGDFSGVEALVFGPAGTSPRR
jgi:hypothetical protein